MKSGSTVYFAHVRTTIFSGVRDQNFRAVAFGIRNKKIVKRLSNVTSYNKKCTSLQPWEEVEADVSS